MSIAPHLLAYRKALCRTCHCGADFSDPCATCEKGRFQTLHDCQNPPAATPSPSLRTMVKTAAAAAVAETQAILAGVPAMSGEEIARRLDICAAPCEHFRADTNRCHACGCFLKYKSALRTGHCPVSKW